MKKDRRFQQILITISIAAILAFFTIYAIRVDFTADKRYSIAPYTKQLIKNFDSPLKMTIYLNGELNPAFHQLRKATMDMIDELSKHAAYKISVVHINPAEADSEEERLNNYSVLANRGLKPSEVYMRDKEGKSIRKIIFPWIEITFKNKTIAVALLKNIHNKSGEENISISIENLEFEISDALNRLRNKKIQKIAFLEGHGESSEAETYQITKSLSRYYQIDRGKLQDDASVLNDYSAVIIANPKTSFSEKDKFILDQYIMYGGRVLWLINGVRTDKKQLARKGFTPAIEMDLNLNDLFFKYGIRINPVLIKDLQCIYMPVNIAPPGKQAQFDLLPWYYGPLLLGSHIHPITKHTGEIKSEFVSTLSIAGNPKNLQIEILLASSNRSKIMQTPAFIYLNDTDKTDENSFDMGYLPVAAIASGIFPSNFTNRMIPENLKNNRPLKTQSVKTKQLFVAGGSIAENETNGIASDTTTLALGYDRIMNITFGNETFLVNAINFLTDQDDLLQLRSRTLKTRLLNKDIGKRKRATLQVVNVALPLMLLSLFALIFNRQRKKKFT